MGGHRRHQHNDVEMLRPMVARIKANTGRQAKEPSADFGYLSDDNLEDLSWRPLRGLAKRPLEWALVCTAHDPTNSAVRPSTPPALRAGSAQGERKRVAPLRVSGRGESDRPLERRTG